MAKKYKVRPPIERFKEKYIVDKHTGCWLWQGSHHPNGYGRFNLNSMTIFAHRASYMLHVGDIPKGLVLDHLCRNTRCVNPGHLEVVTYQENRLRAKDVGQRCPHDLGKSKCIECRNEYQRKAYWKNRDARLAGQKKWYRENIESQRERSRNYYYNKKELKDNG